MASVGNSLFSHAATSTTGNSATSSTAAASSSDTLASQSTFLQLLVAQLQNQDPTTPMDSTTFVTQLAQFSDLEQNLGTRQDLDALSQYYLGTTPSTSSANGTTATTDTTGTTGSVGTTGA